MQSYDNDHITTMMEACDFLRFIKNAFEQKQDHGVAYGLSQIIDTFDEGLCHIEMELEERKSETKGAQDYEH